jgi:hypothetical protein
MLLTLRGKRESVILVPEILKRIVPAERIAAALALIEREAQKHSRAAQRGLIRAHCSRPPPSFFRAVYETVDSRLHPDILGPRAADLVLDGERMYTNCFLICFLIYRWYSLLLWLDP